MSCFEAKEISSSVTATSVTVRQRREHGAATAAPQPYGSFG
jgi:hypothetical protein